MYFYVAYKQNKTFINDKFPNPGQTFDDKCPCVGTQNVINNRGDGHALN